MNDTTDCDRVRPMNVLLRCKLDVNQSQNKTLVPVKPSALPSLFPNLFPSLADAVDDAVDDAVHLKSLLKAERRQGHRPSFVGTPPTTEEAVHSFIHELHEKNSTIELSKYSQIGELTHCQRGF